VATRFLAKPLSVLDRLYRFVEGQSPTQVELSLPVQMVHDVSRQAELGAAAMGFFISGQDNVHAGVGTIEASWDPYQEVAYLFPNVTDLWVWLIAPWATIGANPSRLTSAVLSVGYVPYGEMIVRRDRLLWVVTGSGSWPIYDQNVSPATLPNGCLGGSVPMFFPVVITPGSTMRLVSVATDAVTVRMEGLFWAGPVGVMPPAFG